MAYWFNELGTRVKTHPERARKEILVAVRAAKGDASKAASALGVARRTLDRWFDALAMWDQVDAIRQKG